MFRTISRRIAGLVSDYPLKTAGAIAVFVGGSVAYRSLVGVTTGAETVAIGLTPAHFVEFASTHPAYVLAIVVGIALLALAE